MPFWQLFCIINCCAVIVLTVIIENKPFSLFSFFLFYWKYKRTSRFHLDPLSTPLHLCVYQAPNKPKPSFDWGCATDFVGSAGELMTFTQTH